MLTYYRKKQIRENFNNIKINNNEIKMEKLNENNYKFFIKKRPIYITLYNNKKDFLFNYDAFNLTEVCREKYTIKSLLELNKIIKSCIKRNKNKC